MNSKSHYPVVGVVESGVLALKREFIKRDDLILIIATKATVKSKRYQIHLENLGFKNKHCDSRQVFLFLLGLEGRGIFGLGRRIT